MAWAFIIVVGVLWVIFSGNNSGSSSSRNLSGSKTTNLENERVQKFGSRVIDKSKTLHDRNLDIIESHQNQIKNTSSSYHYGRSRGSYYYIENAVRDCINDIALAEGNYKVRPNSAYLSNWKNTAPKEWQVLSNQIESIFKAKQKALSEQAEKISGIEGQVASKVSDINTRITNRVDPLKLRSVNKRYSKGNFNVKDLNKVLKSNQSNPFVEKLNTPELVSIREFKSEVELNSVTELNKKITSFNKQIDTDNKVILENKIYFEEIFKGYKSGLKQQVVQYFDIVIDGLDVPLTVPKTWDLDYDEEQQILILEVSLPDVVHGEIFKDVSLKSGNVQKPLNQKEVKEEVPKIHPAIMLRYAYDVFVSDSENKISLLVVNGWVEYDNPATGLKTRTYTSSLVVEREQILAINLEKLDPIVAFANLKGKSAGKLIDIIPVTPVMTLNTKDKRFIDTKEVLDKLGSETNLASMDWQDFESLIAELFEKEFANEGAEIKVTQASRDRGVDAVIFNPDPIKGGKYIVQAKRYNHTVDVSAVRDLCAVVKKEGASKGILVTTSQYGSDAYAFAQNEPVTLLNGSELLGLLQKHGYKFRINLEEAKKINR